MTDRHPSRQEIRAAARSADKLRSSQQRTRDLAQALEQGGYYLAEMHTLEDRLMSQVMAVRDLMASREGTIDRWADVAWREAIAAELDGVLPILREMQDLAVPPAVRDVAHLIARYTGSMLQWATTLQRAMRAANSQEGANLVACAGQHMDIANDLRYDRIAAKFEHIAQQMAARPGSN